MIPALKVNYKGLDKDGPCPQGKLQCLEKFDPCPQFNLKGQEKDGTCSKGKLKGLVKDDPCSNSKGSREGWSLIHLISG